MSSVEAKGWGDKYYYYIQTSFLFLIGQHGQVEGILNVPLAATIRQLPVTTDHSLDYLILRRVENQRTQSKTLKAWGTNYNNYTHMMSSNLTTNTELHIIMHVHVYT